MRWLLLLGAELVFEGTLEAAVDRLHALGPVETLTPVHVTAARDGGSRRYRNQLVSVGHPGPSDELVMQLKRIECALGRGREAGVPLDIDLLAVDPGHGWMADAHALAKREFDAPHVRALLAEAGLGDIHSSV